MLLKIISTTAIAYEGEAKKVTLPGAMGAFTVLDRHATLISTLVPGKIAYTDAESQDREIEISGGIADIDNNVVSVCIY